MEKVHKQLLEKARSEKENIRKKWARLKKGKSKEVDALFHERHANFFKNNDCLSCANCCKTTSPIFRDIDIKRISRQLKIKENTFIENYLRRDEDQDYVLKSAPCVFLDMSNNMCRIYDFRPLACSEYPHTDRKNMIQILDLTLRNTEICPAVASIAIQLSYIK